ncbi:MAG: ribokinase [Cyanobacteria bacterium P01_D01_bin.1]
MDILVFGSLNMDLVARVARLPLPGETLMGSGFVTVPGGKGANQAVAAARLGASVAMVGRVGDDGFGERLRSHLQGENIDTHSVNISTQQPSGTALIAVAPDNNQIIVISGANGEVGETELKRLIPYFEQAKVLLLQFEVPLPVVQKAAALAYQAGLLVIVDPAPAQGKLTREFCKHISVLTPNQTEAGLLTGMEVVNRRSAITAAESLHQQGIDTVIVKLGKQGGVCVTSSGSFEFSAFTVEAVDTVAAGDAFNGGLAAALCQTKATDSGTALSDYDLLRSIIRYANAVAALAVTRPGAQSAMPTAAEVKVFLDQFKPLAVQ